MLEEPESDSELRRRAAWLLAMLAVVAVLFVLLLVYVLDSGGNGKPNDMARPDDTLVNTPTRTTGSPSTPTTPSSGATTGTTGSTPSGSTGSSRSTAPSQGSSSSGPQATRTCPTDARCALQGDYGKAIEAINAYREDNGRKAVPGSVSKSARECAKNNGSGCTGGWAESQVPSLDGDAAVDKVKRLGKLLDPMDSFTVGWAYDPGSKQYFFAVIRNT